MEFDLTALRDTVFGEFLSCAMMSDGANIIDYDQSKLDLEITLNGNKLDFQKLFTIFEVRLKSGNSLLSCGLSKDELIQKVELALRANDQLISSVNRVQCSARDSISSHITDIQDVLDEVLGHSREEFVVGDSLKVVLSALKKM